MKAGGFLCGIIFYSKISMKKPACLIVADLCLRTFHIHVEDMLQIMCLIVVESEQKGNLALHKGIPPWQEPGSV